MDSPSKIRIVGGKWRGRKLNVINIPGLRPTQDRTRETLFNWLQGKIVGARCTFCQRGVKGYRTYSANDLETHVLELKEKYNVGYLETQDENAFSNKKQAYEVARIMKKCGVFWKSGGVRCTSVNYEDLKFFKEHNLISISFGIEITG